MLSEVAEVENAIRMIQWFEEQGCYLIVMERPEKYEELYDVLSNNGLVNEDDARPLFGLVRILVFEFM